MENRDFKQIGFGTWKLKNDDLTIEAISNSIKLGFNIIDTASSYGNEKTIGKAIKLNSRNDIILSGKLWNTDRDNVINACKQTIKNLQCDYLDVYLMHWPASKAVHDDWKEINNYVWRQMEECVELGLTNHIGVSNFNVNQLEELLKSSKIKPMINQIECHPGHMPKDIINYCKENNIIVQAWSPIGSGKLLKKQELIEIAEKYNKSVAQICLRWCLQNGVYPIVRTTDVEKMKQNLDIYNFQINDKDMEYLNSLTNIGYSGLDSETITLFG